MTHNENPPLPKFAEDIIHWLYGMPISFSNLGIWNRVRIAVTEEELAEYKAFQRGAGAFYHAIKGIPLQVEQWPTEPQIIMEFNPFFDRSSQ